MWRLRYVANLQKYQHLSGCAIHVIIFNLSLIMVRGRIKDYRQYQKSFVTRLTTGCDTVMQLSVWQQSKCEAIKATNKALLTPAKYSTICVVSRGQTAIFLFVGASCPHKVFNHLCSLAGMARLLFFVGAHKKWRSGHARLPFVEFHN